MVRYAYLIIFLLGNNMSEEKKKIDESDFKLDYKIQNVVATVIMEITEKIDLIKISRKYEDVEYNPERFPGLIMRIKEPKATFLIFSTGKMVITGLKRADEASPGVKKVVKYLKKAGINVSNPEITIQNIVASGDLHTYIDLNMAAIIMENVMYEPEVFPGVIYRMGDPKTVFLLFSTGKVVCTGAKNKEIVRDAFLKIYHEVRELGITKEKKANIDNQDITFV